MQPVRLLCPWGFSRPEYWSGQLFPSPGDLPNPGIELRSPTLKVDSFLSESPGNDYLSINLVTIKLIMVYKSTKHKCLIKHHKVDVIMSDRTLDLYSNSKAIINSLPLQIVLLKLWSAGIFLNQFFFLDGCILSSGMAGSYGNSIFSLYKEPPYCSPQYLHQFTFPPTMQKCSFFFTHSPVFIICRLFIDGQLEALFMIGKTWTNLYFY